MRFWLLVNLISQQCFFQTIEFYFLILYVIVYGLYKLIFKINSVNRVSYNESYRYIILFFVFFFYMQHGK